MEQIQLSQQPVGICMGLVTIANFGLAAAAGLQQY